MEGGGDSADSAEEEGNVATCKDFHGVDNCLQIHTAASPEGPFTPVHVTPTPWSPCNNPAPAVHPNGTVYLACAWSLRRAPSPEGPWTPSWPIAGAQTGRIWLGKSWEDPFLWFDKRGYWHILAHAYTMEPVSKSLHDAVHQCMCSRILVWRFAGTPSVSSQGGNLLPCIYADVRSILMMSSH